VSIKIYVEGGGNQKRTIQACRAAFSKYFEKIVPPGARPRIVACGSRQQAFNDFTKGLTDPDYERVLLLVDSEGPVLTGDDTWTHLRKHSRWNKPNHAPQNAAHMMVQCMESWFLADKESLQKFYGQHFNIGALPARAEIELIPKADVSNSLANATQHTPKGQYHKTRHGFDLLGLVDPHKVEAASPFAEQLHQHVRR